MQQAYWNREYPDRAITSARLTPDWVLYQLPADLEERYIILDTNSKYNIIGEDTTELLHTRMKTAEWEPPEIDYTSRIFKYSRTRAFRAQELLKFEVNLMGKPTPIAVHLVPRRIPFIIGQE